MTVHHLKFVNRIRVSTDLLSKLKEVKAANSALSAAISMYLSLFRESVIGHPPTRRVLQREIDLTNLGFQNLVFKFKVQNGAAVIVDVCRSPNEGPDGDGGASCLSSGESCADSFEAQQKPYIFSPIEDRAVALRPEVVPKSNSLELASLFIMNIQETKTHHGKTPWVDTIRSTSTLSMFPTLFKMIEATLQLACGEELDSGITKLLPIERSVRMRVLALVVPAYTAAGLVDERSRSTSSTGSLDVYSRAIAAFALGLTYPGKGKGAAEFLSCAEKASQEAGAERAISLSRLFDLAHTRLELDDYDSSSLSSLAALMDVIALVYSKLNGDWSGLHGCGLTGSRGLSEEHDSDAANAGVHPAAKRLHILNTLFLGTAIEITNPENVRDKLAIRNNLAKVSLLLSEPIDHHIRNTKRRRSKSISSAFVQIRSKKIADQLSIALLPDLVAIGAMDLFEQFESDAPKLESVLARLLGIDYRY